MDRYTTITLHPEALGLLLKHRRKFNDVLGHLEIDYMGIALLTPQHELLFLSSRVSIECNLIYNHLWACDPSLQKDFFEQGKPELWSDLYNDHSYDLLRQYKLENEKFSLGISVPSCYDTYQVVYSFALKSTNELIKQRVINNIETLTRMGRFCLQNILNHLALPCKQPKKPFLTLIVNNEVNHVPTS